MDSSFFQSDIYIYFILPFLIFLARIFDVTIGTIRIILVSKEFHSDVISAKSAIEIDRYTKWTMENASMLICPVLIMQAGNDKIIDKKKTEEFYQMVKSADKTYKEYDGFLHEVWNEKGRAQVYQDMYIWLEKHLK